MNALFLVGVQARFLPLPLTGAVLLFVQSVLEGAGFSTPGTSQRLAQRLVSAVLLLFSLGL